MAHLYTTWFRRPGGKWFAKAGSPINDEGIQTCPSCGALERCIIDEGSAFIMVGGFVCGYKNDHYCVCCELKFHVNEWLDDDEMYELEEGN